MRSLCLWPALGWLGWLMTAGCDAAVVPAATEPVLSVELPRAALQRATSEEAFTLGQAEDCRVQSVELRLAERRVPTGERRVAPDVRVLRVQARCASGQAALQSARAIWRPPGADGGLLPSEDTTAPAPAPGQLQWVYQLPETLVLPPGGPFGELRLRSRGGDLDLQLSKHAGASARPEDATAEPTTTTDACTRRGARLRERLAERFAESPRDGPECNVLGWLAPLRCRDVRDDSLLDEALSQRKACDAPHVRALWRAGEAPAPADLRVALRRDRCPGSLDRCPRYTLVVYANGVTVFHGEHLVNALGRSDGQTHPRLVAGLWQRLDAMGVWTRRAPHGSSGDQCAARGSDRGALITVEARGRSQTLVDREGCRGPFSAEELEQLADWIDSVAGVEAWTDPPPAYADRQVRVWNVSPSEP